MVRLGAVFAMIAVIAGAFGAHALKKQINPEDLDIWNKAVLYQFIHAIGLIVSGSATRLRATYLSYCSWFFTAGIIMFSGSLYILSLRNVINSDLIWLGPVTPFGGICFICGWFMLFVAESKKN
jgi:uncharacterized membrane protein YgdD (TMEM256/DUF423 family)